MPLLAVVSLCITKCCMALLSESNAPHFTQMIRPRVLGSSIPGRLRTVFEAVVCTLRDTPGLPKWQIWRPSHRKSLEITQTRESALGIKSFERNRIPWSPEFPWDFLTLSCHSIERYQQIEDLYTKSFATTTITSFSSKIMENNTGWVFFHSCTSDLP